MQDVSVRRYVDKNHRLFSNIAVDACMDHAQKLKVTSAWLRNALPADRALDRILAASEEKKYTSWGLLLALRAKVAERIHREEETANTAAASNPEGDPIAALIEQIEGVRRKK